MMTSFSVLPAVCTLRFSLLYYIASTLLYSTVLYYAPFPALFAEVVDAQRGLGL